MEGPYILYLKRSENSLKGLIEFFKKNNIDYVSPYSGNIGMGESQPKFNTLDEVLIHFETEAVVYLDFWLPGEINVMTMFKQDQQVIYVEFIIYDINVEELKFLEQVINEFSYTIYDQLLLKAFDYCHLLKRPELSDFYI